MELANPSVGRVLENSCLEPYSRELRGKRRARMERYNKLFFFLVWFNVNKFLIFENVFSFEMSGYIDRNNCLFYNSDRTTTAWGKPV